MRRPKTLAQLVDEFINKRPTPPKSETPRIGPAPSIPVKIAQAIDYLFNDPETAWMDAVNPLASVAAKGLKTPAVKVAAAAKRGLQNLAAKAEAAGAGVRGKVLTVPKTGGVWNIVEQENRSTIERGFRSPEKAREFAEAEVGVPYSVERQVGRRPRGGYDMPLDDDYVPVRETPPDIDTRPVATPSNQTPRSGGLERLWRDEQRPYRTHSDIALEHNVKDLQDVTKQTEYGWNKDYVQQEIRRIRAEQQLRMKDGPITVGTIADTAPSEIKRLPAPPPAATTLEGAASVEPKALLETLFPTFDSYMKKKPLVPVQKVADMIAANPNASPELVEAARQWALTKTVKAVQPGEIVAELTGGTFNRGRIVKPVKELAEGQKKIPGAPPGVATPQQEAAIRRKYINTVEEGIKGRDFYTNSGKSILFHAGDDPVVADQVGGAMAVTSAANQVGGNSGMGIKAHNQFIAGDPFNSGRFPKTARGGLEDVYSASTGGTTGLQGLKVAPFQGQLARGGGYEAADAPAARKVHDIWDGELRGYRNADGSPRRTGFSPSEHRWMDEQDVKIIDELNTKKVGGFDDWNTGNAQAAGWTGIKLRTGQIQPGDAAKDYADYMPQSYATMSRDFMPGGPTKHLEGLASAPMPVREEFARRARAVFYDDFHREIAANQKGMLSAAATHGPGIWAEGGAIYSHPGSQSRIAVGTINGGEAIDPSSLRIILGNEAEYGLLTGQTAIAGTKLDYGVKAAQRNAVDLFPPAGMLAMDSPLLKRPDIIAAATKGEIAIIPIEGGTRILNTGMADAPFQQMVKDAAKATSAKAKHGRNIGFYMENPWGTTDGMIGQEYIKQINAYNRGIENFNKSAPRTAAQLFKMYESMNKDFGFPLSKVIMDLNESVAMKGYDGVLDVAKKYGIPLAQLTGAVALVTKLQNMPTEAAPSSKQ